MKSHSDQIRSEIYPDRAKRMPFDENYFQTHTYKNVSFSRFSQYWWSNRFYAALARRFVQPGARLLEIGSGLGHLSGLLERTFSSFAVEVNFWALERSKEVAARTRLQAASAEALPFEDGSFRAVIIKHVVEHLQQPEKAIVESGRIMATGGILFLSTPNLLSFLKPWKGPKWYGYQDPTHISLRSPEEWLQMIREAGFQIKRIFSDGFWDAPYLPVVPTSIQKYLFGSLGGLQAMMTLPFLPLRWGESIIVISRKTSTVKK
jgi:2-polyprenyl-3-methyl-5-hydroxy-6-metoxy-1,4-benzoquinol methylase